ncbi:MAG: Wzz/FepE/Etk N-terminal domain-containing protein, partial [Gemmatimonadales bacterium]
MPDHFPENRMLPGSVAPAPGDHGAAQTISLSHMVGVLRRRWRVILTMTAVGAAVGAFLAARQPPTYEARALIRLAGERRQLTGNMEAPEPELGRTADPILSLVELVRSRSVLGEVVDSLGLQLQSGEPDFPATVLTEVRVDPRVGADSVMLEFTPDKVNAQFAGRQATAPYGGVLRLGAVQFAVPSKPTVDHAVVYVAPREAAIGSLNEVLLAAPRVGTDIIQVSYQSDDPALAARIVNMTVTSFQALNIQSAREKSKRRRLFLEEQFDRTDSMLNKAQAELASFRSRQQLASSTSRLEAEQTAMITLEGRRAELEADRNTYVTLLKKLKTDNDADREEALRALASSPALGDNPS